MARVLGILRGLKRGQHTNKHKKIKNLGLSRIEEMNFSIGIYSCPMDHLHFTTTLPVFRWIARGYDWSLVNGYWSTLRKFEKEEALQKVGKRPLREPESRFFYLHFISMKEIPQISRIKNSSRYL